jgi:protein-S-isoprenylcysteine O-methyltransferase Ste14
MNKLNVRAWAGLVFLVLSIGLLTFLPAWTLSYWQAWVFLGTFTLMTAVITAYLIKFDPELLRRRVKAGPIAESDPIQKIIQSMASGFFISIFLVSSLDHRFAWSRTGDAVALAGDFMVVAGLLFVFRVFKENSHTSALIEVEAGQKTITTGPYALIRHPMYAGALVMLLGTPLSLGSWWGLLAVPPLLAVILWRLTIEEVYLEKNLGGYSEYKAHVKFRLLPFIW